jgi:hypothetical protein
MERTTRWPLATTIKRVQPHVLHATRLVVLWAPQNGSPVCTPDGYRLVRINARIRPDGFEEAEMAMHDGGEPPGLAEARFAHGDEFFGWRVGTRVVSFGWVTYSDRLVGPVRMVDARGRAFLFNFHSLKEYRGKGLYPALLLAIRGVLGRESTSEFFIDVNSTNTSSASGITKAGFSAVAEIQYLTVCKRWPVLVRRTALDEQHCPLS